MKARRFQNWLSRETALMLALWAYKCDLNSNLLESSTPQFTTLLITIPFRRLPMLLGKRHSHFTEDETEAPRA